MIHATCHCFDTYYFDSYCFDTYCFILNRPTTKITSCKYDQLIKEDALCSLGFSSAYNIHLKITMLTDIVLFIFFFLYWILNICLYFAFMYWSFYLCINSNVLIVTFIYLQSLLSCKWYFKVNKNPHYLPLFAELKLNISETFSWFS